jgi:hypothetical protein
MTTLSDVLREIDAVMEEMRQLEADRDHYKARAEALMATLAKFADCAPQHLWDASLWAENYTEPVLWLNGGEQSLTRDDFDTARDLITRINQEDSERA